MHVAEEEEDISFFRPSVPLRVNHSAEKKKSNKAVDPSLRPESYIYFFFAKLSSKRCKSPDVSHIVQIEGM